MDTVVFRTIGPWGAGKGANLTPGEVDSNFWSLVQAIVELTNDPATPVGIASISVAGTQMTITLTDGSVMGPYTLPVLTFRWRDEWTPTTLYAELDVFKVTNVGIYMVEVAHTSGATFDGDLLVGGEPALLMLFGSTDASLSALPDVEITDLQNHDFLRWVAVDAKWENIALGTLAYQNANAVTITGGTITGMPAPSASSDVATKAYVDGAVSGGSTVADSTILSNISGATGPAIAHTLSAYLDYTLGTVHGTLMFRSGAAWVGLAPGTSGQVLTTRGTSADPQWAAGGGGAGGVTAIHAGTGIDTGGADITTTGTIALATVATGNVLANVSGATAAPTPTTLTAILDAVIGSARGTITYRSGTAWTALAPGTTGNYLKTQGSSADPMWDSPAGSGTVTSVGSGTGLTGGPITSTGSLALAAIADSSVLANISGSSAAPGATTLTLLLDHVLGAGQGQVIYRGASNWASLSPGTNGYYLQTRGSGSDPQWAKVNAGGGGGGATAPSLWHTACDYATAAALPANTYVNGSSGVGATLTATANAALSVDGSTVSATQRILVKNEAAASHNGIYVVTAVGSGGAPYVLTRAADYDDASEIVQGTAVPISNGAVNDSTAWVQTTSGTITVGTTSIAFEALTATMPIATAGQVVGNPNSYSVPAVPTSLSSIIDRAISATQGAVLYRGASAWSALAPGTAGQVLTTGGAAANPSWAAAGGASLPSGTAGDQLVYVSGAWTAQRPRYIIGAFVPGVLTASQILLDHRVTKAITIPANFGAYLGHTSMARGSANATGSTAIDVQKALSASPGSFSSVGTITIAAGAMVGTFATSGGAAVTFAQGDTLALIAPATPDATFAGFAATLVGFET